MSNRQWVLTAALGLFLALAWRPGTGAADEIASKKIYPETLHATVWLLVKTANGYASGSGWVADRDRKLVVTCHHVVAGADTVQVYFPMYNNGQVIADRTAYVGKVRPVAGRVLDTDSKRDLAVIEMPSLPLEATELKMAAQSVPTASTVHTVGNPGVTFAPPGQTPDPLWKYTRGEVSSVFHQNDVREGGQVIDAMVVQTQEPINPGDSGGPVVNDDGELVGVNAAVRKNQNSISYAIDVTEVKAFLGAGLAYYHPESAADFKKRGLHYLGQQRADVAVEDFNAALRLEPKDAATYRNRGDAYKTKSAWEKAVADYVQVLRLEPQDGHAFRERGACFYMLDQYDQSLDDLGQALRIAPDDHKARLFRALGLRANGDCEAALKDLDALLTDGPESLRATGRYERGQTYFAQSKYDKAIEDLEAAVALAPGTTDARNALGTAYFKKGDVDKAVASYDAALKVNPQFVPALLNRGRVYFLKPDYDRAAADYDAALKVGESSAAYAGRGLAYSRKGDLDKALADLIEALRLDPKDAASYRERASVCLRKGLTAQAVADATEAIRLNPSDAQLLAQAYNDRGVGHAREGHPDKAIADYSNAIDRDPKNVVFYTNRAVSQYNSGAYDQVIADCTKAIEFNPQCAAAYLWRSRAYEKMGKEEESKKDMETAVQYDPTLKK